MLVSFNEYFVIKLSGKEEWFNPLIEQDTKLFIDPFLVDKVGKDIPEFVNSHDEVISFFNEVFQDAAKLVTRSGKAVKPLLRSLTFPEVNELYLGYAKRGNPGAGSGKGFSKLLLDAVFELIDSGITEISRFEELELFKEGFGADRIGDMMGVLLKSSLVKYTNRICKSLEKKQEAYRLKYMYHSRGRVWQDEKVKLPCVKDENGKKYYILLVPKCFLRHLPTIDIGNFWDYCYSNENDAIRSQFGDDIKKSVDKETMFAAARRSKKLRESYLDWIKDKEVDPYDIETDPELFVKWYHIGKTCSKQFPFSFLQASNYSEFIKSTTEIIDRFKHFIEERGGWRILRDDESGKGKREDIVQRLFDGITSAYCEANNIDYSPEVDAGRGPVDFKYSQGYRNRTLIEVKLARNSKLLKGLENQLPSYLKSHKIKKGYLIVVIYEPDDFDAINKLRDELPKIEKIFSIEIEIVAVDAQEHESASKI